MKYFTSEIEGKTINDFMGINPKLLEFEKRMDLVNVLLNDENGGLEEFFSVYFSEYYNVSPSQNGYLAEQDAVCKTLERLGTYLLNAKDITSSRKIEYRFWKSIKEFNKYKESKNTTFSAMEGSQSSETGGSEIIDMFGGDPKDKNYKKSTDARLFAIDFKEIKEIRELQKVIDTISQDDMLNKVESMIDEILPSIKEKKDKARLSSIKMNVSLFLNSWKKEMCDNQVLIKTAIKKPIYFKNIDSGSGAPNKLDIFDFMHEGDVAKLIPMIGYEGGMMSDIGLLIHDINIIIDDAIELEMLSSREMEIITKLRENCTANDIVNELDIKKQNVKTYINRIAKKLVKVYEKRVQNNVDKNFLKK